MIVLLVITDGRHDCLRRTLDTASEFLVGPITERVMFDDTGDENYRRQLRSEFPDFTHLGEPTRQGFGGAIRAAWRHVVSTPGRFVFHVEGDFAFTRPIDLASMARLLDARPKLVQLALRRQPWNDDERAAGGIVEQHPESYSEHEWDGAYWLEHRRFFTTNPSLYRRSLCLEEWPEGPNSEGRFTHQLLNSGTVVGIPGDAIRFGFWGARNSGEWVTHIGHERVGIGY